MPQGMVELPCYIDLPFHTAIRQEHACISCRHITKCNNIPCMLGNMTFMDTLLLQASKMLLGEGMQATKL